MKRHPKRTLYLTLSVLVAVLTFGLLLLPTQAVVFDRPGGTGNVTSNEVVNIINNVAPSNSGITQPQMQNSLHSGTNNYNGVDAAFTDSASAAIVAATSELDFGDTNAALGKITFAPGPANAYLEWDFVSNGVPLRVVIPGTVFSKFNGDGSALTGIVLAALSTNVLTATNQPFTAGQALVYVGTNSSGQPVFKGTNWPSGGGSSFPLSGDVSAANHAIVGISDLGMTNSNTSSDAHLIVGATGAGGYLVVSLTGNTNGTPSFTWLTVDKITATTINATTFTAATAWQTNTLVPTNAFGGTVVNLAKGSSQTNLGGNLTFTDISNYSAGGDNTCIIKLFSGGADRTIAFPASWHTNYNFVGVVTNGWEMDLMFTVTANRTNVAQILYP